MAFVHHIDALSFLAKASTQEVRRFSTTLNDVLKQYVAHSPLTAVSAETFLDKLADIRRLCLKNQRISAEDREFVCSTVIPSLAASLEPEKDAGGLMLPLGICHGDLTLSNILIASQTDSSAPVISIDEDMCVSSMGGPIRIVLIDFLDSFVETPLADMAKLCQDLKYAWTIRVSDGGSSLDTVHFFTILGFLLEQMESAFASYEWYQKYFRLLFVMNQLRVPQYSKDEAAARYLSATVREEFAIWKREREGDVQLAL
jgi:thiamine kinase-like enzyme